MPLSKRRLYSSLLGVGLAIFLVASSVSAMAAYGYTNNVHNQATQSGWKVGWTILTGPATVPLPTGQKLQLQSMISTGSCDLTGMLLGTNAGTSGECHILAIVNAVGAPPSVCEASFALGASKGNTALPDNGDPVPFAWAAVPSVVPYPTELAMFYPSITSVNGQAVNDFRVSSSTLLSPGGSNTGLCSSFLFEGFSADTFVPAQAGHFNFSGTPGLFGTFLLYTANVHATYSHGHNGN